MGKNSQDKRERRKNRWEKIEGGFCEAVSCNSLNAMSFAKAMPSHAPGGAAASGVNEERGRVVYEAPATEGAFNAGGQASVGRGIARRLASASGEEADNAKVRPDTTYSKAAQPYLKAAQQLASGEDGAPGPVEVEKLVKEGAVAVGGAAAELEGEAGKAADEEKEKPQLGSAGVGLFLRGRAAERGKEPARSLSPLREQSLGRELARRKREQRQRLDGTGEHTNGFPQP